MKPLIVATILTVIAWIANGEIYWPILPVILLLVLCFMADSHK